MNAKENALVRLAATLRISKSQKKELNLLHSEFMSKFKQNLSKSKNEYNLRIKSEYLGGSIKKETAMNHSPDIDVVVLFEFKTSDKQPPSVKKVLIYLSSCAPMGFHCKIGHTALTISRKKITKIGGSASLTMDIVPALCNPSEHGKPPKGKWYWQIDPRGQRNWVKFNPTIQDEIMLKLHRRSEPDDPTTLLICLKRWRSRQKGAPRKLSSYVLEVLVWDEYVKRPTQGSITLVKRFNNVLRSFKSLKSGKKFENSAKPPNSKSRLGSAPFLQNPANSCMDILGMSESELDWWIKKSGLALKNDSTFEKVFN